jgi:hypothetical protein
VKKNHVNQAAVFCVKNALKLTSDHLRLEKFSGGTTKTTRPPRGGKRKKGRIGEEREGKKGRGGGRGYSPSKNVCLSSPLQQTLSAQVTQVSCFRMV